MSKPSTKERFALTIEDMPSDVPSTNRLRRLLKAMLGYRFRVLECREIGRPVPPHPQLDAAKIEPPF